MLKRLLLIGLLCSPIAAWAFFKPVRVIAPELAGVTCLDDKFCIDDLSRSQEAAELYEEALQFVDTLLGPVENKPRVIFCSADACAHSFALGRRAGMTLGTFGIVISPRAWKPYYVRHEMIHHLQNERLGMFAAWIFPQWFIEGMAYSLSEDPRAKLSESFDQYRSQFNTWYAGIGKESLWSEARKL